MKIQLLAGILVFIANNTLPFTIAINHPYESYVVSLHNEQGDCLFDVIFQAYKPQDKCRKAFCRTMLPSQGIIKVRVLKLMYNKEHDSWLLPNRFEVTPACDGSATIKLDLAQYKEENLCLEVNAPSAENPLPIHVSDTKPYVERFQEYQQERQTYDEAQKKNA